MKIKPLSKCSLGNKKVLLRADMNVPVSEGKVTNKERIIRSLPTIKFILKKSSKLIVLSHLGRPKENNIIQEEFSLQPVARILEEELGRPVKLIQNIDEAISSNEEILILENIRFFKGEKNNDLNLSKQLASLADIFVMDAFATSHRSHASTVGVTDLIDDACSGLLIQEEMKALDKIIDARRPILAVLGGSKISSKLSLINTLSEKADHLILGGGIANTCWGSLGKEIGNSLTEVSMYKEAKLLSKIENVLIPDKVIVAKDQNSTPKEKKIDFVAKDDSIYDISPNFFNSIETLFNEAATIIWNGPMGLFEEDNFSFGTKALASMVANSDAYSVIGGGDTISAASKAGILDSIDYISTAGGAFLEYIEGKSLPALEALKNKNI